jgi:hypothetical protein
MKYESLIICHSKDMANVKVFKDKQNRRTGQKLNAPDLSIQGHTIQKCNHVNFSVCVIQGMQVV